MTLSIKKKQNQKCRHGERKITNHKLTGSTSLGSVLASPTILGPKQSKLSKLIWTFTQTLLLIVEIGFISLSL